MKPVPQTSHTYHPCLHHAHLSTNTPVLFLSCTPLFPEVFLLSLFFQLHLHLDRHIFKKEKKKSVFILIWTKDTFWHHVKSQLKWHQAQSNLKKTDRHGTIKDNVSIPHFLLTTAVTLVESCSILLQRVSSGGPSDKVGCHGFRKCQFTSSYFNL